MEAGSILIIPLSWGRIVPIGFWLTIPYMRTTLRRKIAYVVCILFLAIPLYFIGYPAQTVVEPGGDVRSAPGGFLAQYRSRVGLSEAQMGEIDPASSTIKLATFGMRGVALSLLWHQANEKQKRHEWNDVVAIANQIIFLEPHFITIWDFLGWTLAYNASADFDDYRERYRWVIRGIDFIIAGTKVNQQSAVLYGKAGWTISQKIGIADEVEQYRRLLREDDAFGARVNSPLPSDRDNWILGRRWYHQGEDLVRGGVSLMNQSDFVYFANSRLNLFNYAKWLRKDGIFGEEAMQAWEKALEEWIDFGRMDLATAIPGDGTYRVNEDNVQTVKRARMDTTDLVRGEEKELLSELDATAPELKRTLCIERWQQLGETAGQQGSVLTLLEKAPELTQKYFPCEELQIIRQWLDDNEPDWQVRLTADKQSRIPEDQVELRKIPKMFLEEEDRAALSKTDGEIAEVLQRVLAILRVTPTVLKNEIQELEVAREMKSRARDIVEELDSHPARIRYSDLFRGILNYESRFREVAIESNPLADDAHRIRYEARKAYYDGRLADSLNGWLDAMRKWDELIDNGTPSLVGVPAYLFQLVGEFTNLPNDSEFVRDHIDLAEKLLIILDDSNKIFSDVSGSPVPLHRLMWSRAFQEADTVADTFFALDYAKGEYVKALAETDPTKRTEYLETVENYFKIITQHFTGMNYREKYMEYAPFFDLRDRMVESVAYYIRSLEQQGKPLPEPLPLRAYVELILKHDPAVGVANEMLVKVIPILQDKKYDEAQSVLDEAVAAWLAILDQYPLIAHDPTNSAYGDVVQLAIYYADMLQAQEKSIPEDFPLKKFLMR